MAQCQCFEGRTSLLTWAFGCFLKLESTWKTPGWMGAGGPAGSEEQQCKWKTECGQSSIPTAPGIHVNLCPPLRQSVSLCWAEVNRCLTVYQGPTLARRQSSRMGEPCQGLKDTIASLEKAGGAQGGSRWKRRGKGSYPAFPLAPGPHLPYTLSSLLVHKH